MAKKNKEYNKVWNEFHSELTDGDLQSNYDEFVEKVNKLNPQYEDIFIHHQKMENEVSEIKDAILMSALNGVSSEGLNRKLRDLESAREELEERMNVIYSQIKYYEDLISKYEDWSERKLFVWWKVFTVLNDTTPNWIEWKRIYNNNII
jgi:chaperonin cofactor prefoldin